MSASRARRFINLSEEGSEGIIEDVEEGPLLKRMGIGYCKVTTIHGLQYMPRTPVIQCKLSSLQ